MERNTKIKIAIGSVVFLVGGYLVYKQLHQKAVQTRLAGADDSSGKSGLPQPPAKIARSHTSAADMSSGFPLRRGVRNNDVVQLQEILGITADGIFGAKTEATLMAQAGVKSVDSTDQMDEISTKIVQRNAMAAKADRAQQLYNDWKNGTAEITATGNASGQSYIKDAYGAIHYGNLTTTLRSGYRFNRDQYIVDDYSKNGKLMIKITVGDNAGDYAFDTDNLTLA